MPEEVVPLHVDEFLRSSSVFVKPLVCRVPPAVRNSTSCDGGEGGPGLPGAKMLFVRSHHASSAQHTRSAMMSLVLSFIGCLLSVFGFGLKMKCPRCVPITGFATRPFGRGGMSNYSGIIKVRLRRT